MSWFLTALLCVLLVELALRLPFAATVAVLSKSGARAVHVVRAKSVSDHWKEKALAAYAQTTFLSSLKLAGLLLLLVALATLAVVALDPIFDGFQRF